MARDPSPHELRADLMPLCSAVFQMSFLSRLLSRSSKKESIRPPLSTSSGGARQPSTSRTASSASDSLPSSAPKPRAAAPMAFLKLDVDEKAAPVTEMDEAVLAAEERAIVEKAIFSEEDLEILLKLCQTKMKQLGTPDVLICMHLI